MTVDIENELNRYDQVVKGGRTLVDDSRHRRDSKIRQQTPSAGVCSWRRLCENAGYFDASGTTQHYCRSVVEVKNLAPTLV
jgi:hypothetical protein